MCRSFHSWVCVNGIFNRFPNSESMYRVFLRDVTAAILVSLNKETAAPTNPWGIELVFFCFGAVEKQVY